MATLDREAIRQRDAGRPSIYGSNTQTSAPPSVPRPTEDAISVDTEFEAERGVIISQGALQRRKRSMQILREFDENTGRARPTPYERIPESEYNRYDPDAEFIQSDPDLIEAEMIEARNPQQEEGDGEPWYQPRKVANFLFSDEMGLLGIKWDEQGVDWAYDNFKRQLIEHPYSTAFTVASYLVPIGAAWMKGARMATHAAKLADTAGDAGAFTAKGLFGTVGGAQLAQQAPAGVGNTLKAMKMMGPRVRFDDHARFIRTLIDQPDDFGEFLSRETVQKLKGMTDEQIAKAIPEKELRKLIIGDMAGKRYANMKSLAKLDQLNWVQRQELKAIEAFGNKYWDNTTDLTKDMISGMDRWMTDQRLGNLFASMPSLNPEQGKDLYRFFAGKITKQQLSGNLSPTDIAWAESLKREWTGLTKAQFDEGFIDMDTFTRWTDEFGGFHLPAIKQGTPGFTDLSPTSQSLRLRKMRNVGRGKHGEKAPHMEQFDELDVAKAVTGPTTKQRKKYQTWDDVDADLDKLITDPHSLTVGGFVRDDTVFQLHRVFRNLITGHMKGGQEAAKVKNWVLDSADYANLPEHAKARWMHVDDLSEVADGLGGRVRRMIGAQAKREGFDASGKSIPYIDRDVVSQFFGKGDDSATSQVGVLGKLFELLTATHKTSKTALNPATHVNNVIGNFAFIGMSGVNPFGKTILNDGKTLTNVYTKLTKSAISHTKKTGADIDIGELMTADNLKGVLGDSRFIDDKFGNRIDLAEVLSDPRVMQMSEAQSFEVLEGFARTKDILKAMEQWESTGFVAKGASGVARAISAVSEVPGIRDGLKVASSAYLGEDMVPKLMLLTHHLRNGWSVDAAVKEVGRRMPQYLTVGRLQQSARRHVLPWITFQSEAARILKNNIADSPVAMMTWLHAPQLMQATLSGAGLAPTQEEIEGPEGTQGLGLRSGAPGWADKYSSVFLNEDVAGPTLGAIGGASVGGVIGTALGGAKGALMAGALGGAAGAGLGFLSPTTRSISQDQRANFARSWALDFLPNSSLAFATAHPTEWEKLDPMNDMEFSGKDVRGAIANVSPLAVGSIITPLIQIASGEGSFGQEINTKGMIGHEGELNKMAMGIMGFLAPPAIQKYGMKIEGPGGELVPMAEVFENNGGQMTLPRHVIPTVMGLAASGLTLLGGSKLAATKQTLSASGQLMAIPGKARLAKEFIGPAIGAGGFAALAGTEVNTRRLMEDLGLAPSSSTGDKTGDWVQDGFFNTFMGVNKSYAVAPGVQNRDWQRRKKSFDRARIMPRKQFQDALKTGRTVKAARHASEVYKTFLYQYAGDPKTAHSKFIAFIDDNIKSTFGAKQFRGWSLDDLERQRRVLLEFLDQDQSNYMRERLNLIRTEQVMRQAAKANRIKIVDDFRD